MAHVEGVAEELHASKSGRVVCHTLDFDGQTKEVVPKIITQQCTRNMLLTSVVQDWYGRPECKR